MKKYIIPTLLTLFIVGIFTYAAMQPSTRQRARATELYKAKMAGDKEKFVNLYGASDRKTIHLYEERLEWYKNNQERVAEKRAMAEKAWKE